MNKIFRTLFVSVVSAGLALGLTVAPANAAPINPGTVSVSRGYSLQDGSFSVYSGEQISVYSRYVINTATVDTGETLTFAATGDITGLSTTWNHSTNGQPSNSSASTFTVPTPKPSEISLTVTKTFSASSSTTMHYLPTVTASNGAFTFQDQYTSISVTVSQITNGYTAKLGDETLNYNLDVCVDLALVEPNDSIELTATLSQTVSNTFGSTFWSTNSGNLNAISPQTDLQRTIPNPEPTLLKAFLYRSFSGLTAGTNYVFSADIKKAGASVTLASCPSQGGGGYTPPPPLFSLGGASVSGTFTVGQVITATPNSWSRTSGGEVVTITSSYDWLVCSQAQAASTTNPAQVPCIQGNNLDFILANGTSIGQGGAPGSRYQQSSLTITQPLLDALTGKYLLVVVSGQATSPTARSNVFMQTCGPISAGTSCSVAFGTAPPPAAPPAAPPALASQTPPAAVPAAVKAKKKLNIPAKAASGLAVKVTASGGCKVKPVVKTVTTKIGKKKVKTKVTTGYTVTMGKKGTTCTITQSNSGDASYDALNSVTTVTAS